MAEGKIVKIADVQRTGGLQLPRVMYSGGKGKILKETDVVKPFEQQEEGPGRGSRQYARSLDLRARTLPRSPPPLKKCTCR